MAAGPAYLPNASGRSGALKRGGVWWTLLLIAIPLGGAGMSMRAAVPAAGHLALGQRSLASPASIAFLLAACLASIVLHECGHLVAALLLRFEIRGGSFGPLRAMRLNGQWRLRLSTANALGASVIAAPQAGSNWRGSALLVTAAGPLATLFTGLASIYAAQPNGAHPFFTAMAQLNLLLFILCLVPIQLRHSRSDAKLFLDLLQEHRGVQAS